MDAILGLVQEGAGSSTLETGASQDSVLGICVLILLFRFYLHRVQLKDDSLPQFVCAAAAIGMPLSSVPCLPLGFPIPQARIPMR